MKIDVFTTVMAAVFILAIFGPLIYLEYRRRNRIRQMRIAYLNYITTLGLQPGHFETWSNKTLATDKNRKVLIFMDGFTDRLKWKSLTLSQAAGCRVLTTKSQVLLVMDMKPSAHSMPESIKLFDDDMDDPLELGFHKVLANRWADRINRAIKRINKKPRKAA